MASGDTLPVDKEWQQIEEEITCSICGDLFTDPKTISCLHTFCKQCIERSIESNKKMASVICCPLCRTPLAREDISSVPINFTINRLIEIFGKRKEAGKSLARKEMKCNSCDDDDSPAVTWCVECENCLCEFCNGAHKRIKAFKSHKIVLVEEFIKNPKLVLSTPEKPEDCKTHNKQSLDLYCKTCSSLICRDCTLKDHPRETHDFDFIDDVVDEEREKIKQATAPLQQFLERVRDGIKRIEENEKDIDVKSEANRRKIQGAYDEVYKLLKQQEEEALQKVNTIKTSLKKTLAMQKENVKFMESQLVSCMEFSNDAISTNRTQQLLTYKNSIIDRVEDLTKQVEHASIDPECRADDMIVRCAKPAEFISDSLCDVSGIPHLPHCSVRGPLEKSDPVKVTVSLKDVHGFPVVQQSKDIEIRCNNEVEFLQNVRIEEESNGHYHIWYNPKRKDHLLSVYWRGLVVNDEEVKVLGNIRDYASIKEEVKVIDKYGPNNEELRYPCLMAKGPNNEVIVRNYSATQLVIFDEQLQYSHVIGGRGNGNGKFQLTTGIAVDCKGYLYVADYNLHCIQKFTLSGQFVSQFGSEGTAEGQFNNPYGLVLSQSELLFVCDCGNNRIQVYKNEVFSHTFGQYGKEPGCFNCPYDLALNSNEDQLFITDNNNHRVQVFTPSGQFLRIFGNFTNNPFKLQCPLGIYYTADNHLLISSSSNNCVLVFEVDGRFVSAIEGTYQGKKRFIGPCGVIMMDNGQIVIAGNDTNKLVVF